ncbi:hypothetical protein BDR04DRAFT_1103225 [Suillus decipiens]|nr:hypothetical protein BDR04DRAFT_1103225 [Suillus decipiens]
MYNANCKARERIIATTWIELQCFPLNSVLAPVKRKTIDKSCKLVCKDDPTAMGRDEYFSPGGKFISYRRFAEEKAGLFLGLRG